MMREIDTEVPVVWPAWCYSGEITSDTSPQTASSPSLQISPITASSNGSENLNNLNNKNRTKRKPIQNNLQYSVEKMLNERNKLTSLIENNKKLYNNNSVMNNSSSNNNNDNSLIVNSNNSSSNLYYDKMKNDNNMNFIKNGQLSPSSVAKKQLEAISLIKNNGNNCSPSNGNSLNISNNNISNNSNGSNGTSNNTVPVKSERLSPLHSDITLETFSVQNPTLYRSRSVTPSSFSGTPPQTTQPNNQNNPNMNQILPTLNSSINNSSSNNNRSEVQQPPTLNYSDMMRNLAAKYNNSNDFSTPKNPFMEPRVKSREPNIPTAAAAGASTEKKSAAMSPPQVPNPNFFSSLLQSLPLSAASIFNPMLDMSSTRALIVLSRAAQEAEMQKIMKEYEKMKKSPDSGPLPPSFINNLNFPLTSQTQNFGNFNPFPALTNLQALQQLSNRSPPAPETTTTAFRSPVNSTVTSENQLVTSPLDLSSSSTPPMAKRIKLSPTSSETTQMVNLRQQQTTSPNVTTTNNQLNSTNSNNSSQEQQQPQSQQQSVINQQSRKCQTHVNEISAWNVDQVCEFVQSIDICAEYVNNFREQSIDGDGLTMLTEEHLINILGMKLGPALKLRSKLIKKMSEPCDCGNSCGATTPVGQTPSEGNENSNNFINNFNKLIIPRAGSADSAS